MSFSWVDEFLESPQQWQYELYKGHYNYNYVVYPPSQLQPALIRVPRIGAAQMDLRCLEENNTLQFLERNHVLAPRLLYQSPANSYKVLSYISGQSLKTLYPSSRSFPSSIIQSAVKLIVQIQNLGVPKDFYDSIATPTKIIEHVEKLYQYQWLMGHDILFMLLGMPEPENFIPLWLREALLGWNGTFVFAHSDLHRGNLIIAPDDYLVAVDWELAALTAPAYDIATHFHRAEYSPVEQILFMQEYSRLMDVDLSFLDREVKLFLSLELIKSVLIDSLRLVQCLQNNPHANNQISVRRLFKQLMASDELWGCFRERSEPEILTILCQHSIRSSRERV